MSVSQCAHEDLLEHVWLHGHAINMVEVPGPSGLMKAEAVRAWSRVGSVLILNQPGGTETLGRRVMLRRGGGLGGKEVPV